MQCNFCENKYANNSHLNRHIKAKYPKLDNISKESVRFLVFDHETSKHANNLKMFNCRNFDYVSSRKFNLELHIAVWNHPLISKISL